MGSDAKSSCCTTSIVIFERFCELQVHSMSNLFIPDIFFCHADGVEPQTWTYVSSVFAWVAAVPAQPSSPSNFPLSHQGRRIRSDAQHKHDHAHQLSDLSLFQPHLFRRKTQCASQVPSGDNDDTWQASPSRIVSILPQDLLSHTCVPKPYDTRTGRCLYTNHRDIFTLSATSTSSYTVGDHFNAIETVHVPGCRHP